MARRQRAAAGLGVALAALSFLPALIRLADERLFFHVLQEMLLLVLVAPLLAFGIGAGLGRHVQDRVQVPVGILALNLSLFGAQVPAVVNLVAHHPLLHAAAQLLFLLGAVLFWSPIIRPRGGNGGLTPIAKIGYLMVASVPPTIPGITLAFSHHLFYAAYRSIEDQQLAGLLLFATAKCALVTGTFVILWRLLTPEPEPSDDDDRGTVVPDGPSPAPAWFARLDDRLPGEPVRDREPVRVP